MQAALHDPRHGYYAQTARIGSSAPASSRAGSGDFTTAPQFHGALAQALAQWAGKHAAEVTRHGRWHLIEVGSGTGKLALEICRHLTWRQRRGLHYHLVETSPRLTAQQQQTLASFRSAGSWPARLRARFGPAIAWHWHTDVAEALGSAAGDSPSAANGAALIFSNELVDAFAAVILRATGDRWQEVCLEPHGETLREVTADCRTEVIDRVRQYAPSVWDSPLRSQSGQQVEVHLAYAAWLEGWASLLTRGRLLTIDYGDTLPGLYHRRPRGTLRGYFYQQRIEGPECFERFGGQDLTCDVNFSDLEHWGEQHGLRTIALQSQAEFIAAHVPSAPRRARRDPRLAYLLDPHGMGGAVQVLEQGPAR